MAIFRRFPTTFWRFPKIRQNLSEDIWRVRKITEDFQRRSKNVLIIHQQNEVLLKGQKCDQKCYLHVCGQKLYPHMWDVVFINLLPLVTPLTFIYVQLLHGMCSHKPFTFTSGFHTYFKGYLGSQSKMCCSRKYPYSPHRRGWNFLEVGVL